MPLPRHVLTQVRATVRAYLHRVLGARRGGGVKHQHGFARAVPASVELTEHYRYRQEISRNPIREAVTAPTGKVEITLPYDGHEHFTRQALADVTRQPSGQLPAEVVIGHLAVADHGRTDLADVLGLSEGYGSFPIRVPVAELGPDGLVDDTRTCRIAHDYAPHKDALKILPVDVRVELEDPDGTGIQHRLTKSALREDLAEKVAEEITQQIGFRPYLDLSVVVALHLPNTPKTPELRPTVSRVSLKWPTITSLGALQLRVEGGEDIPVRYNASAGSIEWSGVPMSRVADEADDDGEPHGDTVTFHSNEMRLRIQQPGELYKQQVLDGQVEVEVGGYLLSGTRVRLFNAVGTRPHRQAELTSRITTDLHLILDDAFAHRLMLPYQHFYFDEVIPDDMRIADIVAALKDKGFTVMAMREPNRDENLIQRVLVASRAAGPDTMRLWLLVEGRRFETERRNQLPGGHTFKSTFDSGELKVFMGGSLPGTSRELTHVMNALQLTLRERFERLKARR